MAFAQKTIPVRPFTISHSEQEVADLKTLIRLSPLSDETYENNAMHEHKFGPSRAWMQETKSAWQDFDWFSAQADLNRFPHFIAEVPDVDPKTGTTGVLQVHFIGIESPHPDAVPVMILHGWPGNFFELLPLVSHLLGSPSNPPMHLIIPSLIGCAYSSKTPLDREIGTDGCARLMNSLMKGLGYEQYVVQGGDLGAFLARYIAIRYDECKAIHVNYIPMTPSVARDVVPPLEFRDRDEQGLARTEWFLGNGFAYASEQATRPATIGYCIESNPIALLAWVGEKFLHWTDAVPTQDHMLTWLTLYWLTKSYASSIFYYRDPSESMNVTIPPGPGATDPSIDLEGLFVDKPLGYSKFPMELKVTPEHWAQRTGNLVFFKEHSAGGHFAATEQPERLAADLVAFLEIVWQAKGKEATK